VFEPEHVPKHCPEGIGLGAVQQRMGTNDRHENPPC
jgi:hypothetical protein